MTGGAGVDPAAGAAGREGTPIGLTMLGSSADDPATTDGHCDDGYCAIP